MLGAFRGSAGPYPLHCFRNGFAAPPIPAVPLDFAEYFLYYLAILRYRVFLHKREIVRECGRRTLALLVNNL